MAPGLELEQWTRARMSSSVRLREIALEYFACVGTRPYFVRSSEEGQWERFVPLLVSASACVLPLSFFVVLLVPVSCGALLLVELEDVVAAFLVVAVSIAFLVRLIRVLI